MSFAVVNVKRTWNLSKVRKNFLINLSKNKVKNSNFNKFPVTRDNFGLNLFKCKSYIRLYNVNYIKGTRKKALVSFSA